MFNATATGAVTVTVNVASAAVAWIDEDAGGILISMCNA